MKNGSLAVYVKITASHHFDDLRLFHLFRIGSAPRFTSCPYGTEHFVCIPFLCNVAQKWRDGSGASGFAPRPGAEFAAAVVLPIQAVFAGKLQTALVAVPLLELAGQVA